MANYCSCFSGIVGRNKKNKGKERFQKNAKVHAPVIESAARTDKLKLASYVVPLPYDISRNPSKKKVMIHESSFREAKEVEYEAEDEKDVLSTNRNSSVFDDPQDTNKEYDQSVHHMFNDNNVNDQYQKESKKDEVTFEVMKSGNISDPGIDKRESWTSTLLTRSCSDLAKRDALKKANMEPSLSKSQSFEKMRRLTEKSTPGSPISVSSHCSADKIILKKHSSSHILPSRSRKLWWKLFLWSHRNVKATRNTQPQPNPIKITQNKQGGYSSDTLEPGQGTSLSNKLRSRNGKSLKRGTGLWLQNQWVSSPAESSIFSRVESWVKELPESPPELIDEDDDHIKGDTDFPPARPASKALARNSSLMSRRQNTNYLEEVAHANNMIQSLNSSSTVAHIAGTGLKVSPIMSHFSSLRSVNLSGNSIVQITPGSLPKGLQILNVSRNQIHTIGGLKELTRLRVIDLSYNKISHIGRGLSNCTFTKELYLAGNKISYVEGLHRLLKLTVLDLSFNKITTTNALRQLVANYNSLIALNLLGNPIQSMSDEQLRKTVCSLLRKLVFLNKQAINPKKAREQAVADAAVGNSNWSTRRRTTRKAKTGISLSARMQRNNSQKIKLRQRSQSQCQSSKTDVSAQESSAN